MATDSYEADVIFPKKQVVFRAYFGGWVIFSLNISLNFDIFLLFVFISWNLPIISTAFWRHNSTQQFNEFLNMCIPGAYNLIEKM